METLKNLALKASKATKNKTAAIILRTAGQASELSAATYLIHFKCDLISDGSLKESDYKCEGGNAWDDALYSMQQSGDAGLYDDSLTLAKSLA